MKLNGNLEFHTLGAGEIRNAVIERLTTTNRGLATHNAGRIVFDTDLKTYYYSDGDRWVAFSTGGNTAALQTEVDNLETALGSMFNSDGTANTTNMDSLVNVTGATTLSEVLSQLDAAIEGNDTLAEMDDVTLTDIASNEILKWNGTVWVNNTLAEAGIQPLDATLTALAAYNTNGILVQTAADTFVGRTITASTVAGDQGISVVDGNGVAGNPTIGLDIAGLTDEAGTPSGTDTLAMFDGTNNVKVSVTQLKSGVVASGITLGDLSDVTDALSGTLTTSNKYFFNATSTTEKALISATLGGLNNVADAVDSASLDDVLAFDGSAWTAITVNTMLADGSINDLSDVTVTTPATGHILYYDASGSPDAGWLNAAPGATSGVQPYDAGLADLAALAGNGIVVQDGADSFINRSIATASINRITVTNGDGVSGNPTLDLATVADSNTGTFEKVTVDSYGRVTGTTAVLTADITALVDSTYVNVTGDTMNSGASLVFSGGGTVTGLPTVTANASDATSKAYVDNLVASGTTWRDPVQAPNLMDIVSAQPVDPTFPVQVIKWGGTQGETWTGGTALNNVNDGDILEYDVATDTWTNIGTLTTGDRFVANGENTAPAIGSTLFGAGVRRMDLIQYVAGSPEDPTDPTSWTMPHADNNQAVMYTADLTTGLATGLANDATEYTATVHVNGTPINIAVTGSTAQTWGNLISQINVDLDVSATASIVAGHLHITGANENDIILITDGPVGSPGAALFATAGAGMEIRGSVEPGTTVLVSNVLSAHNGRTGFFSGGDDGDHSWVEIGGPSAITAGVGLAYSGNTLNINLGAGIVELPSDEVGIHLFSPSAGAIILTTDGTARSTASGASLHLLLDGSTLEQGVGGLKVAADGITGIELHSSVAGDGLVLTTGGSPIDSQLDVDYVVGSGLTITAGQLDLSAIPNNRLANSSFTVTDNSTPQGIDLGGTLTVVASAGTGVAVNTTTTDTITISGVDATTSTKGVASFNSADFTVTAGAVSIANGGVSNAQLANSTITMNGDSGTDAVALGETFTITGGVGVTTTVGANSVTVAADSLRTSDLVDVTADATAAGMVMVAGTPAGSPAASDYTPRQIQYIHTESVAATTWTVTHNLGQKYCVVTVVDSTDQVIIPESITFDSTTQLTVTFNTAITGKVVVMGVAGVA